MYGRNMFSKIVLLDARGAESELRVGVRSKEYRQHLYRVWSDIFRLFDWHVRCHFWRLK